MTSRRRIAAGFAALVALTGTLVFGGAIAAQADAVIEFTSPADGATFTWAPSIPVTLTGTTTDTDNTHTIDILDYSSGGSPDFLCTGIDPSAGTWSCEWPLSPGAKDIRVFQNGMANSDTVLFTFALPTHTVTGPTTVAAAGTVNLTGGNGYPGANITAVVTTPSLPALTCSTSVVTDGTWGCDIPFDAELDPDSDPTVTVTQTYGTAPAVAVNHTFHVAAAPPAEVTIDAPVDGLHYTWDAGTFASVSGRAPVGAATVDVLLDGVPAWAACQALPVDSFGQWTCGSVNIDPGSHSIIAQQTIATITYTDTANIVVEVPAPDVSGLPLTAFAGDTSFSIFGNYGLEGYTVYVELDGGSVACDSTVDFYGDWNCILPLASVSLGAHTIHVRQEPTSGSPVVTSQVDDIPFTFSPAPSRNCAFPAAGFGVTGLAGWDTSIYAVTPSSGGGKSSGGSDDGGSGSSGTWGLSPQGYCNGDAGYVDSATTLWDADEVADCGVNDCSLTGLAAGIYEVFYFQPSGNGDFDYLFRIPATPGISTVASTTNSVLVRGNGTAGDTLRVERANGSPLCTTTVTGDGTWVCQFTKTSTASARVIALDPQSGGRSAYSASRAIPVYVPAAIQPDVETPVTLVNWFLEFGGNLKDLKPGDKFTLNVSGMPVGTEIEVWMHSTPVLLGTATGTGLPMTLNLTVPANIESGDHEIKMIGITPLGTQYFYTSDATVTGGTLPAEPLKEEPVLEDRESATGDRTDPAAPSGISDGLAPLSAIVANPATIAIAGGLALALLFLVALPTELLNSSLSSNTSRLGRAYGAVDGALTKAQDWFIKVTRSRAIAAIVLTTIIAIIYGFVDPGFGFDIVSLRLVLSLALAFFLLTFVASWISGLIIRRAWGAIGVVAMQPSIILFAIVGVIVARVLEFSPGFLVGVAIGLELLQASRTVSARAVFVQIGVVTGLSLAAWVVYSVFVPGNDFAGMLVEDTMVALTAEGLTGALIALVPLKFLDGHDLWAVSKRLWVAAFLIVATAFALLVLPTAIQGTDVADYGVWLLVFAVFGLVSLAVWLVFVRADKKAAEAEQPKVDA